MLKNDTNIRLKNITYLLRNLTNNSSNITSDNSSNIITSNNPSNILSNILSDNPSDKLSNDNILKSEMNKLRNTINKYNINNQHKPLIINNKNISTYNLNDDKIMEHIFFTLLNIKYVNKNNKNNYINYCSDHPICIYNNMLTFNVECVNIIKENINKINKNITQNNEILYK